MFPADQNPVPSHEEDSLQREIAYLETWLEHRPAVAPIVLNRLGELGRELRADLPRLLAERKVKANVAKLRAKRDHMREVASVAALIATAPSVVIAAPAVAAADTQDFQMAAGEEAASASLILRVMDALTGKPLAGVKLMTVAQEVIAVTDARGQAPVPAKFAGEGVLSLERDGYPIVLIQGAKLAGRSLVTMRPFSEGSATASRKKPATTAKKSTGPIVKLPTPPTSSALDEAMAVLRGAPNAPDNLAAVTPAAAPAPVVQPEAPAPAPVQEAPVVEAPVVAAAPIAPAPPAPVHQAASEGDYGPIAAPAQVAAAPVGIPAQVAPPAEPVKPAAKPVVALKKPVKANKPVAAKPATPKVAAKPAPVAAKPAPVVAKAEPRPAVRPLLPIAPPIVSVSEAQKLATATPVDETYGPTAEAPVAVAAAPVAEAPVKPVAKPVVAIKKPAKTAKPVTAAKPFAPKPVASQPAPVVAAAPARPVPVVHLDAPKVEPVAIAANDTFGPEPEVRPVLPIVPAPELPVVAAHEVSATTVEAAPVQPVVEAPVVAAAPIEPAAPAPIPQAALEGDYGPIEPPAPVAAAPVAVEAPVAAEPTVVATLPNDRVVAIANEARHYSATAAEASPTPTNRDLYGPTVVAQAPDVEVPGHTSQDTHEHHEAPMSRPAAPREPVATHAVPRPAKAVVVPKQALKPKTVKSAYYKVRPGDSLSLIARDLLGDMMRWPELYAANRDKLTDPSWLPIGLSLKVPRPGESFAVAAKKTYVVRHGDSLSLIAKRHLGDIKKWPQIYAANRNTIADPTLIFPGQRLVLPTAMAAEMPPLSWANLQASYAPAGMGGHDAGDEPRLALGGEVKYSQSEPGWEPLMAEEI